MGTHLRFGRVGWVETNMDERGSEAVACTYRRMSPLLRNGMNHPLIFFVSLLFPVSAFSRTNSVVHVGPEGFQKAAHGV